MSDHAETLRRYEQLRSDHPHLQSGTLGCLFAVASYSLASGRGDGDLNRFNAINIKLRRAASRASGPSTLAWAAGRQPTKKLVIADIKQALIAPF